MTLTIWGWLSVTSERISRPNRSRKFVVLRRQLVRHGKLEHHVGLEVMIKGTDRRAPCYPWPILPRILYRPSAISSPIHSLKLVFTMGHLGG